jgi:glycogen debranching enzyme
MSMNRLVACVFVLSVLRPSPGDGRPSLDTLGIVVRGISREYSFTNKQSAFLYGETNAPNRSNWEGFNVAGHEFLDDYILVVDGHPVDRASAVTTVFPDYLVRSYPEGIVEEVHLADSVALLAIHVSCQRGTARMEVLPFFTDFRSKSEYLMHDSAGVMLLARTAHLTRSSQEDYPVWLAVYGPGFICDPMETRQGNQYSPFMLKAGASRRRTFVFAVANRPGEAWSLARTYEKQQRAYITARRHRMERLLTESEVTTADARFTRALAWAKLSLDALIMNQGMHGIFAGLPWFNNYWGRDTFISLPGAALVTGRFNEARDILRSFCRFQETDSLSRDYGRIPNLITPPTAIYNTADGTPRFVIMAKEYVERSGDTAFIREIYPVVRRAMIGTQKYHMDSLSLLTHGDAESWMDAVGPNGPWSPRGNRANDVEALWLRQIDASAWFARQVGDDASADAWEHMHGKSRRELLQEFVTGREDRIPDRLHEDGTPDTTVRPNQIFLASLLNDESRATLVRTVLTRLTYAYGVASLSQDDPNFHPYHQDEPYYPKDAAYHNGTVWTWLQGPLISELCYCGRHDIAWRLTENSVHQILERGAVGTQSELLDAVPRPGETEPRLSGTFSQAWTLAEFIRNFYDDYLGVRMDRFAHRLTLRPHLTNPCDSIQAMLNFNGKPVQFTLQRDTVTTWVLLDWRSQDDDIDALVELSTSTAGLLRSRFQIPGHSLVEAWVQGNRITVLANNRPLVHTSSRVVLPTLDSLPQPFEFLKAAIHPGLRALRGPDYPLLTNDQIKQENRHAIVLANASDSVGDDRGTGSYTYPLNANFPPGIFDITHFTLAADSVNAYFTLSFKALSDPGWHPEYGFQLTYVAIAIDEDGVVGSGRVLVPHNARYRLDPHYAYEKLLLVGGGIQLEDTTGKVIVAYIPVPGDEAHPLGKARTGGIDFALPLTFLGKPTGSWTFTILAGAQDDHGGSGLGEFRTVNASQGEWNGGGKPNPEDPNIYDVLTVHLRPKK